MSAKLSAAEYEQAERQLRDELATIEQQLRFHEVGAGQGSAGDLRRRADEIRASLTRLAEQQAAEHRVAVEQLRASASAHEKAAKKASQEADSAAARAEAALHTFVDEFAAAVAAGDRLDAACEAVGGIGERWHALTGRDVREFAIPYQYRHRLLTECRGEVLRMAQACTYIGIRPSSAPPFATAAAPAPAEP